MTERERFIKALRREPLEGHVPTFELVFFLTMEAFGKVHPAHRRYTQWDQMSVRERELQLQDMASCYIDTARRYHHSAIFIHPNPGYVDDTIRLLEIIRERTGDEYYLTTEGDSTFAIPDGEHMLEFTTALYEEGDKLKEQSRRHTEELLVRGRQLTERKGLLDGFTLCSDYCFNTNPFFSPEMFDEFIAPDLKAVIQGYHDMGCYVIKHTDGNIMPIAQQIIDCGPDALHSLDPQGGVDLKEMKRKYGRQVALCGNVNCGLLQTGSDEECIADVERCLRDGMEGWGYIFCTSNCVYTGMPLERYEMMNKIWWEKGIYPAGER